MPARSGNGRFKRTPPTTERARQAVELRCSGMTYEQIAERLGVNKSTAYRLVETTLERTLEEPAGHLRELEAARLDALQRAVWAKAIKGDLWAVDRALRLSEQRSKLLGLDTLEERQTIAAEALGATVAGLFLAFLTDAALALTWEQQEIGRQVADRLLRALPAAA